MLTKDEIRNMVQRQLIESNGQTGEVILPISYHGVSVDNIPSQLREQAEAYAWEMFPDGGWCWLAAFEDYVNSNIFDAEKDQP